MMRDAIERVKAYSNVVFLGDVECRPKRCPHCNSLTLFEARASGTLLSGSGRGGGPRRAIQEGGVVHSSNNLLKLLLTAPGETPLRGKDRLFARIVQWARSAEARPLVLLDEAHLLDRISVRYHLQPLDRDHTAAYIDFQTKQAGGGKEFDTASEALIHDYTGGVPRQINNLATACLLQAAANTHHIAETLLQQTLTEFELP